jgi:ABC-2 type transport system permease protein
MRARDAVRLIARREITERVRERSFLVSTSVMVVILLLIIGLGSLLGDDQTYDVGAVGAPSLAVAKEAARAGDAAGISVRVRELPAARAAAELRDGALDAVLEGDRLRAQDAPAPELVALLDAAHTRAAAQGGPPPLRLELAERPDPREDERAGIAFLAGLLLYGQLLTYGYWVAAGVVEEKSSRVIEVILSAVRPRWLLAGKVLGLGLLALGHLLLIGLAGFTGAAATGRVTVDTDLVVAVALALAWFVAGYAFYACAFACAGALVPRQEELQSATMPLSLLILVSFFVSFGVSNDPDGTLAHVTAFIPTTAPLTMPGRIITGDAGALEIAASFATTLLAAAALIPLAARIYEGGVLRTGSAVKLREAWRRG